MVAQYIAMQKILDLCLKVDRRLVSRVPMRWWKHVGMELTYLREIEGGNGDRYMDKTSKGDRAR